MSAHEGARFVFNNAADRAVITCANTAEGLGPYNLKNDFKSMVCRILGESATIELSWSADESVGAVVIPASNLSGSSLVSVELYSESDFTGLILATSEQLAAPGTVLENWGWDQILNVNSYAGRRLTANDLAWTNPPITAVYFENTQVKSIRVNLLDTGADAIDVSRIVVGKVVSTQYTAAYGQSDGIVDLTTSSRTASGDLRVDRGPKSRTLSFELDNISLTERAKIKQLCSLGLGTSIFVSLCAGTDDAELERDKSIYGRLQPTPMTWNSFNQHSAAFEVEGF